MIPILRVFLSCCIDIRNQFKVSLNRCQVSIEMTGMK